MTEYYKNLSLENLPYVNEEGLTCLEEFRDIPGYEGLYQVSNLGRVRSYDRIVKHKYGNVYCRKGIVLKQSNNGKDYLSILLYNSESIKKHNYVHRLVLRAFEGDSKLSADHKNSIRLDNRLSNLRYLSQRLNCHNQINRKNVTSKFPGVHLDLRGRKKFKASIRIQSVKFCLGYYFSEEQASQAYQTALYNWDNLSITPKGIKLDKVETKIFNTKSRKGTSVSAKTVLDKNTGIFYDSLSDACNRLNLNYKYISSLLCKGHFYKTSLTYV
jgi:hypothetical protein